MNITVINNAKKNVICQPHQCNNLYFPCNKNAKYSIVIEKITPVYTIYGRNKIVINKCIKIYLQKIMFGL